jgi:hypothetical protein
MALRTALALRRQAIAMNATPISLLLLSANHRQFADLIAPSDRQARAELLFTEPQESAGSSGSRKATAEIVRIPAYSFRVVIQNARVYVDSWP